MDSLTKITDIQTESKHKYIECKFASKGERDSFYKLAEKQIIRKACLRNGPFFSDDENVVSIGFCHENKEYVMEFVNQHCKDGVKV